MEQHKVCRVLMKASQHAASEAAPGEWLSTQGETLPSTTVRPACKLPGSYLSVAPWGAATSVPLHTWSLSGLSSGQLGPWLACLTS